MAARTPAPPNVWDFEGLCAFRDALKDTILVTIDLEGVDHLVQKRGQPAPTAYDKLSELGLAIYDPRDKTPTSNPADIELVGSLIKANHTIIHDFRRVTEEICPAFYHRKYADEAGKQHSARPYHCAFARSIIKTKEKALHDLKDTIKKLCGQNRTEAEVKSGKERSVCILYWAAHMEETVFHLGGINLTAAGSDVMIWDLQLWSVFQIRFHKAQSKGEEVFASLGALRKGLNLHNATNDCVAQLLALMRVLSMEESEWTSWFVDYTDLSPMAMDWMKASIYRDNFNMRPRTLHDNAYTRPSQGQFSKHFKTQPAQQHRQPAQHINTHTASNPSVNTQTTSKPSVNTQTTRKPSVNTQPASAPKQDTSSLKKLDEGQKEMAAKGKENAAPVPKDNEVSQFWAKYDKNKVSSTMSKYRKPTTKAASESENLSGWPAGMPGW